MIPFFDISNVTSEVISNEISKINRILKSEKDLRKTLVSYMDKITTAVNNIVNPIDINFIHTCLDNLKKNLDKMDTSILSLKSLINLLESFEKNSQNINIEKYNSLYEENFNTHLDVITSVSSFIQSLLPCINIYFAEVNCSIPDEQTEKKQENKTLESSNIQNELKENTLIISDKDKKVVLPYTISELQKLLNKHKEKYNSFEDIINDLYTVPLDIYKNPSLARFKEAFNLIKNKENGSLKDAFDLGFELFFNSNLNPAIITACKNLDELDIYLSCLDSNELNKFKCFNIIYEYLPTVINSKKK